MIPISEYADRFQQALAGAQGKGANAGRILFRRGESIGCQFEAGRLKETGTRFFSGYEIELLASGRRGSASGNQIDDLPELLSRAISLARTGSAAHFTAFPKPAPITRVPLFAPATATLSREALVSACAQTVEPIRAYNQDLFLGAGGSRSSNESLLVTTGGVCHAFEGTSWSLWVHAQRTRGTDILFAGDGRSWRDAANFFDPAYLSNSTLESLRAAEHIAEPLGGNLPVLVPPDLLGMLLSALIGGFSGRLVAKGDSPLKNRLGQAVFSSALSINDNPHRPYSPAASETDVSGVPTKPLVLVNKGVVEHFLYDLDTAGLAKAEPTGHDGCAPHELELAPGARPHAGMLADIREGLFVKDLIGFGQGNIMNGDFSCNIGLGYAIRNGALAGRVKNTMIAGNLYDLFNRVVFSSDLDPLSRLPHALFDGVSIIANA